MSEYEQLTQASVEQQRLTFNAAEEVARIVKRAEYDLSHNGTEEEADSARDALYEMLASIVENGPAHFLAAHDMSQ